MEQTERINGENERKKKINLISKINAYLALITVLSFIITGYGITQSRTVESITFGLLNKELSFRIHSFLIFPLILFLAAHLFFSCNRFRLMGQQNKDGKDRE